MSIGRVGMTIDDLAKFNLNDQDHDRYVEYKKELVKDGETQEDIELILRGFIWDESERYN